MKEEKNLNLYDDKKMKYIDIVFENCEVYKLDADMIDYANFYKIYNDISINYNGLNFSQEAGEVMSHTFCSEVLMTINKKGLQKIDGFDFYNSQTLYERLKFKDITGFDIFFTDNTHIYLICPWQNYNDNEYKNACVHIKGNENLVAIQIKRNMTEKEIKEFEKDFNDYSSFNKVSEEMQNKKNMMAQGGNTVAEIGHMILSNNKIYNEPVPELLKSALKKIDDELRLAMWNKDQKNYESPFDNSGNNFVCSTFEVCSYNWNEDIMQEYNFKWRDYKIIWYKYFGRDMSMNKKITPDIINEMLEECLQSIKELDVFDNA